MLHTNNRYINAMTPVMVNPMMIMKTNTFISIISYLISNMLPYFSSTSCSRLSCSNLIDVSDFINVCNESNCFCGAFHSLHGDSNHLIMWCDIVVQRIQTMNFQKLYSYSHHGAIHKITLSEYTPTYRIFHH